MSKQDEPTNPRLEKPISIPPGCVSIDEFRELRLEVDQLISENRAVVRLFLPNENGECPVPAVNCQAMTLAKTAIRRAGHPKLWTILGAAIITALGGVIGAAVQAIVSGTARAQTETTLAIQMPKYLKSVAEISRDGGKTGGLEALNEFESRHTGLVVTSGKPK